jgi:DNA polymerase-3 subunit delta'
MYPWLENAWRFFLERLDSERLAHAILLQGPAGTGKSDMALNMAARLLCTDGSETACGVCRSCALFKSGAHPDWFKLNPEEGKHQIRIDAIRETTRALSLTTTISNRKVALICPAEAMNINAANALLKSLEEPTGETVIILVAHDPSRLPVTIRSRCQAINVTQPSTASAVGWLEKAHDLDSNTAAAALDAAGGSPLRAAHYANTGQVAEHQGLRNSLSNLLRNPGQVSRVAAEFRELEPETLWYWLSTSMADAMRGTSCGKPPEWLTNTQNPGCRSLALLQRIADRNRALARTAVRQDLLLEDWLIKWATRAH